jgi:hypothetical protein
LTGSLPKSRVALLFLPQRLAPLSGGSMRVWIAAVAIACSSCLLTSVATAQAAAEGALTHALSSGMGTSLGNAMGHATNQMAGRVAQQTSHAVPRQAVVTTGAKRAAAPSSAIAKQPNGATTAAPAPGGSMIVSIQGGVRQQPACEPVASATAAATPVKADNSVPSSPPASPTASNCAVSADPTAFAHPSEITLPEMK